MVDSKKALPWTHAFGLAQADWVKLSLVDAAAARPEGLRGQGSACLFDYSKN